MSRRIRALLIVTSVGLAAASCSSGYDLGNGEGLVPAAQIRALPEGCLVVMATRARICNCDILYERVLNDELALAADVFDHEPLELGHPLLGRPNVVHTPHNAGRTKDANQRYAEMLAEQFNPV